LVFSKQKEAETAEEHTSLQHPLLSSS